MSRKALTPVNVPWSTTNPSSPVLRAGDLYANSDTGLRLYDGSTWRDVTSATTSVAGTPTNVTRARIRLATDLANSMANNAWTAVVMDVVDIDSDGLWSQTNKSRLVIQQSGTYVLEGQIVWNFNNTGFRDAAIWKNGVNTGLILGETTIGANPTSTAYTIQNIETGPVVLAAGDFVELGGYQSSGGALLLRQNANLGSWLGLRRVDAGNVAYSTGGSQLLARQQYEPNPQVTTPTTSVVPVDVDAVNLKVTFIAPSSGVVTVRLTGNVWISASANAAYWSVALNGTDVPTSKSQVTGNQFLTRASHATVLSGLTAGQQYSLTWRHSVNSGTVTANLRYGYDSGSGEYAPAVIEVYDATIGTPNNSFPQNGITQSFLAITNATATAAWATTTATAASDVDAANAVVSFTAPASGRVLVTVDAPCFSAGGTTTSLFWVLRDTSNNVVGQPISPVTATGTVGSTGNWQRGTVRILVSSLMPGQQYVWKLSQNSGSAGIQVGTFSGSSTHPLVMTVQDAVLSPNMTAQSANPFLLGKTSYNPNPRVAVGSTSTAVVVADTTNLKVSFIAPASGQVLVRLSATAYVYNSNATPTSGRGYWCLCSDTAGTVVSGTVQQSWQSPATGLADQQQAARITTEVPVSGLIPGQPYTYWWGLFGDTSTTTNDIIYGDNGTTLREGAAVMEVWDGTAGQGSVQTPPGLTTLGRLRAAQTAGQSVPASTWTKITLAASDDPLGRWDPVNSQWTVGSTGMYIVVGGVAFIASTGPHYAAVAVNGVRVPGRVHDFETSEVSEQSVTHVIRLNAGDVVSLTGWQGSAGALFTAVSTDQVSYLDIMQLPDTSHAPSATSASQVVGARVYLSANYALAAINTLYTLSWTAIEFDKGGYFASPQPTRLTVPAGGGGTYRMAVHIVGQTNSGAMLNVQVFKNGTTLVGYGMSNGSANGWLTVEVNRSIDLNPGDYLEIQVQQNDFAGATVQGGVGAVHLTSFELIRENSIALTDPTTVKGDMVVRGSGGALARLVVGADTAPLVADSTQALGVGYDNAVWTSYTPTFTNITSGAGTFAYKKRGKVLLIRANFSAGTYTATGTTSFSLPPGMTVAAVGDQVLTNSWGGNSKITAGGTAVTMDSQGTGVSLVGRTASGVLEVQ